MRYQLQDMRCGKCGSVATRAMSETCPCSGRLVAEESMQDFHKTMQLLRCARDRVPFGRLRILFLHPSVGHNLVSPPLCWSQLHGNAVAFHGRRLSSSVLRGHLFLGIGGVNINTLVSKFPCSDCSPCDSGSPPLTRCILVGAHEV